MCNEIKFYHTYLHCLQSLAMASSYAATEEMTNINRVSRLLMDPCTDQLRDLLRSYIPPASFPAVIQRKRTRLPRLTEPQRELILLNSGVYTGNYDDMDISLLYILLRNVCGIQPHNKGWGNTPDSADRSVSANIERLRLARNSCGHSTKGISNADFNKIWSEIRAAVVDLDKAPGIVVKYQEVVDFVRNDTMDPERDKHYREQLLKQTIETEKNNREVNSLKSTYKLVCIFRIQNLSMSHLHEIVSFSFVLGQTEEVCKQIELEVKALKSMSNLYVILNIR